MNDIIKIIPNKNRPELEELWKEYEQQESYEARLVKAIDKVEAQIQHNEADISCWNYSDKKNYATYLDSFCSFDEYLKKLKYLVQEESHQKLSILGGRT